MIAAPDTTPDIVKALLEGGADATDKSPSVSVRPLARLCPFVSGFVSKAERGSVAKICLNLQSVSAPIYHACCGCT